MDTHLFATSLKASSGLSMYATLAEYGKTAGEVFLTPTEIYTLDCFSVDSSHAR
jgi:hypothetical protein